MTVLPKIAILMSTYNGENFLKEQINSIFYQDYKGEICLEVRDDGSTDTTTEILKSYLPMKNRKIYWYQGKNIGPQKSFLELMRQSKPADFYFFSDQDDIWDREKIRCAVEKMSQTKTPVLYCSNYRLTNQNLHVLKAQTIQSTPRFTPLKVIFYNQIPGCTIGFNRSLMELWHDMKIENIMMHDSALLSFATVVGTVIYDPKSRISHRIHGKNVVGEGHKKIIPHKWIHEKWHLIRHKEAYDLSVMAGEFLRVIHQNEMTTPYEKDLLLLRDYKKSSKNVLKLLMHVDSKDIPWDRTTMSIRAKILLRLF